MTSRSNDTHNRPDIVMITAEELERLLALKARAALYARELPDEIAAALEADDIPAAAKSFNHEYAHP